MEQTDETPATKTTEPKETFGRKFKNILKKPVTWISLLILSSVIGYFIKDKIDVFRKRDFTDTKYIAVVMSSTDKTFTIPKEFKQGFGDEAKIIASKGQIVSIEKKDDQYSKEQAKIVAEKLVKDENCIMIIGNSNSELSEVTLNSILDYDGIRPAFILPIATADGIISKSFSENYKSILRMVPDNQNQALIIKRFIFNKIGGKAKVAILVDEENQTYSKNLSKNIASEIMAEDGNIVLNQTYGNNWKIHANCPPSAKTN